MKNHKEFSKEDGVLFGRVQIRSLISCDGKTIKNLIEDYHIAIDDYSDYCKQEGETPEIANNESPNIHLRTDLQ